MCNFVGQTSEACKTVEVVISFTIRINILYITLDYVNLMRHSLNAKIGNWLLITITVLKAKSNKNFRKSQYINRFKGKVEPIVL